MKTSTIKEITNELIIVIFGGKLHGCCNCDKPIGNGKMDVVRVGRCDDNDSCPQCTEGDYTGGSCISYLECAACKIFGV